MVQRYDFYYFLTIKEGVTLSIGKKLLLSCNKKTIRDNEKEIYIINGVMLLCGGC